MATRPLGPLLLPLVPLLLAGCLWERGQFPPVENDTTPEAPFADSVFKVAIEGNDGSQPGDALYVGQSSRLIGSTLTQERRANGSLGVSAQEVETARIRWRGLAPGVLDVESVGRVRALAPGTAGVEAVSYLSDTSAPLAVDTMTFRVLVPDASVVGPRFVEISAAHAGDAQDTCGITVAGDVACLPSGWGIGAPVEGATAPRVLPAPPGLRFHGVVTGVHFACALDEGGQAYCWGSNRSAQLGRGTAQPEERGARPGLARPVESTARFTRLGAGFSHACGVTAEGGLLCWGLALGGGLRSAAMDRCTILVQNVPHRSEPEPVPCARVPRLVPLPAPAVDVSAGGSHTCALTGEGALYCWGTVYGNGSRSDAPRRVEPRDVRLTAIVSGDEHVCGLDAEGGVHCWGRNWNGQLGTGASRDGARRLVRVPGVPPLRSLTAGAEHTCGIARSGEAYCWGENWTAQLGGGARHGTGKVTRVAGDLAWSALAASAGHTCGVASTGALYCWGSGTAFRLEPGGFHVQPEPFAVSGWR